MIILLLRLGLRASEVAGAALDDIDWRAGELRGARQGPAAKTGCRCRPTWARRSPPTCGAGGRTARGGRCSCAPGRPFEPIASRDRRLDRAPGVPARRDRGGRVAPAAPHRRVRDGRRRRAACPDRSGAAPSEPAEHRDLRARRRRAAAAAWRAVAGRCAAMSEPARARRGLPAAAPRARLQARAPRARCSRSSSPTSRPPARRRSPASWRSPGPGCPSACTRTTGRSGWESPAGSPPTCKTIDPTTEIPPPDVFAARHQRPTPYLWSARAGHLPPVGGRRGGCARRCARRPMRRCSGCSPCPACGSVRRSRSSAATSTSTTGVITIREAKFDRVTAGAAAPDRHRGVAPLRVARETGCCPKPRSRAFFLSSVGTAVLATSGVGATFSEITTAHRLRTETVAPADPRPPPQLCRADADRLAPRSGVERRRADRRAVDLPRPRQPGRTPTGTCPPRPS